MSTGVMFQQIMAMDGKSMASESSKTTQKTKTQKSFKDLFDKIKIFKSKVKNNKATLSEDIDIPEDLYNFILQLINFIKTEGLVDENLNDLNLASLENENIMLGISLDERTLNIDNLIGDSDFNEFWQKLISEVKANTLTDETLDTFVEELQEKFPEINKIDSDVLKNQITKLLSNTDKSTIKEETGNIEDVKPLQLDKQFDIEDKVDDENIKAEEYTKFKSEQEKAVDREDKTFKSSRKQKPKLQRQRESKPELIQNPVVSKTDEEQVRTKDIDSLDKNIVDSTVLTQKSSNIDEIEINTEVLQDEPIDFDKVFDKIVQKVDTLIDDETDMVRIRLKPDFLGDVLIKIVSEDGQLKTQLFIENAKVRNAINVKAANLKTQIQKQGYNSVEVDVYDMTDSGYMDYQGNQNSGNQNFDRPKQRFYQNLRNEATKRHIESQYDSWYDVSSVNYMA